MNIEVIRATETWQQAGAYYVRIQGMGASLGDCHTEMLALWILAAIYFLLSCFMYMFEIRKAVGRTVLN